jgi:tricorn protease
MHDGRGYRTGMSVSDDSYLDKPSGASAVAYAPNLLNQYSASDGDLFPHYFRRYGLGPLIGMRSWGGVVGIRGIPGGLVDGGYINVPEFGHYGMQSDWHLENRGVEPDIVWTTFPAESGERPQLERASGGPEAPRERKPLPPRPRPRT